MATLKTRSDAGKAAQRIETARVRLPGETQTTARLVTQGSVFIFRAFAPSRSGRLRRGIRMVSTGGAFAVRADARNPDSGYDYVGVTRRGHRLKIIRPRHGKVLRFVIGGRVLYRTHVKGYRPSGDWAQRAYGPVRKLARSHVVRLAQRIEGLFR